MLRTIIPDDLDNGDERSECHEGQFGREGMPVKRRTREGEQGFHLQLPAAIASTVAVIPLTTSSVTLKIRLGQIPNRTMPIRNGVQAIHS